MLASGLLAVGNIEEIIKEGSAASWINSAYSQAFIELATELFSTTLSKSNPKGPKITPRVTATYLHIEGRGGRVQVFLCCLLDFHLMSGTRQYQCKQWTAGSADKRQKLNNADEINYKKSAKKNLFFLYLLSIFMHQWGLCVSIAWDSTMLKLCPK